LKNNIFIKQSNLINDAESFNDRYLDRLKFLQEFLFVHSGPDAFYESLLSIKNKTKRSPLSNKVSHLENLFFSYLFICHNCSIQQISNRFALKPSSVAWGLLSFFSSIYIDRNKLNNFFQVDDLAINIEKKCIDNLKVLMLDSRENSEIFSCGGKVEMRLLL
jgi:hypothetical protein